MKNLSKILAVISILFMSSTMLWATEVEPKGTMQRKFQRGFLNIALSPIEISNELSKEVKKDTMPPSWIAGAGRGAFYAVGRALVGAYEIVTFAIPYPSGYKPILKPEFAWQELPPSDN